MSWVRRLLNRSKLESDLDKELRYHVERRTADLISEGIDKQEAARRARLEFGGSDVIKEECRDARGTRWLEDFFQDCRYGLRLLRRSPVFTSIAILSLALGIGANTAIFSLMDRLMLRTLPVHDPERLVVIGQGLSYPLFQDLKKSLTSMEGLFADSISRLGVVDIVVDGQAETADLEMASGSYHSVLGVPAVIGRTFTEELDHTPTPVAVISHRYWERRYASDPAVIGKTFRRLNTTFTIIGVTPPEFSGATLGEQPDITVPLSMDAEIRGGESWQDRPSTWWLNVMGRLKPGVGFEQARAEVRTVLTTVATFSPSSRETPAEVWKLEPGSSGFENLRRQFGQPLTILMGTVALVLLLACANLANLLLARSAVRQREIAVRLAVGAKRGRVVRQLLAEGLLLALVGGAIGVFLAYVFAERLVTMMSNYGPRVPLDVKPDGRMLLFALGASVLACALFSLAPALLATRQSFQPALAEIRAARWRLGKALVVAQMAISVLLLIGAGLFGQTLVKLYGQDLGFDKNGVVVFSTNAEGLEFPRERIRQLQTKMLAELTALPGVASATVSGMPPISRGSWGQGFIVEGGPPADKNMVSSLINSVGPDFFKTLRSPILLGREFNARDTAASPRVAIVNDAFAKYYFQDRPALGRWIAIGGKPDERYEIVGVVQGYKYNSLRRGFSRTVYLPAAQIPMGGVDANLYSVRTTASMAAVAPAIEAMLKRFDKTLRPVDLSGLETHVAKSVLSERMLGTLGAFFGGLALLLGTIGIYGVMAFQVARRRREIGIRMALGADARSVVGMILGQTARLTLLGCAIGVAGGLALTGVAKGILYGVDPKDPATFAAAILVLVLVALGAAYVPGRSAARTNPVETLRTD